MEYDSGAIIMSLHALTLHKSHFKIAEAYDYPRLKLVHLRASFERKGDLLSTYAIQLLNNS